MRASGAISWSFERVPCPSGKDGSTSSPQGGPQTIPEERLIGWQGFTGMVSYPPFSPGFNRGGKLL